MPITRVTIGIQARSTSRRFPDKVHQKIGRYTVLEHVVNAASNSALYLNNWNSKNILVDTVLLVPVGDKIIENPPPDIELLAGPEEDVLGRYAMLLTKRCPDYIVRVTADCPLIPSFIISKLITLAVMNEYDYVSNVDEKCRTSPDGMDCEVFSEAMLRWANDTVIEHWDREHVTTKMRSDPPAWAKLGCVINFLDLSHHKLSVDTEAELETVRKAHEAVEKAYQKAVSKFGKKQVHRF